MLPEPRVYEQLLLRERAVEGVTMLGREYLDISHMAVGQMPMTEQELAQLHDHLGLPPPTR